MSKPPTTPVKLSYHDYAAFAFGPDGDGTVMWAQVAEAGTYKHTDDFLSTVLEGNLSVRYNPLLRVLILNQPGLSQIMPNVRLAYFGQVPAELSGNNPAIYPLLHAGKYIEWPGRADPGY